MDSSWPQFYYAILYTLYNIQSDSEYAHPHVSIKNEFIQILILGIFKYTYHASHIF